MTGRIKIEISESALELLKELKKQQNQELKERIQALYWLKTDQVESTGAIASLVGKHRTTVSRWLSQYRIVQDFKNGEDKIGLTPGLTYDQLTIQLDGNRVKIIVTSTGEVLAYLDTVTFNLIDSTDFVTST